MTISTLISKVLVILGIIIGTVATLVVGVLIAFFGYQSYLMTATDPTTWVYAIGFTLFDICIAISLIYGAVILTRNHHEGE